MAAATRTERDYEAAQASLKASEDNVSRAERDWASGATT